MSDDFLTYIRTGHEKPELVATDGAFATPESLNAKIDALLTAASPIRAIANVVKVGSSGYRTQTEEVGEIAPPFGELYANPAASQAMLDDSAFDVEAWLATEISREFAQAEGAAFVGGTGLNRPKGFLTAPISAEGDGLRPFGTVQAISTGAAGAFPANHPQDRLIDLVQALRAPYRQGAAFVMNSATAAHCRKFKTEDGAFLWQPALAAGGDDRLLGYPVIEAEDMPNIAPGSLSIAFGNFRAGYLIAERSDTAILRDPFTNKPFVHFYATKRVGGQVMNSEAIKLLMFSA